jgi:DNA-binding transcriptional MerR regulator
MMSFTHSKPRWTEEELAIVLYFRARGVSVEGCKDILNYKDASSHGQPRTVNSVQNKLHDLAKDAKLFYNGEWSIEGTNAFLSGLELPNLQSLVGLDDRILQMMGDVSTSLQRTLSSLLKADQKQSLFHERLQEEKDRCFEAKSDDGKESGKL